MMGWSMLLVCSTTPAALVLPSGASGNLRHQLEGALVGAEVGIVQHGVGIEYAHNADVVEVQTLGHHLRAYQDVRLALLEIGDDALVGGTGAGGVQVHTGYAGVGEEGFDVIFYFFRAEAAVAQVSAPRRRGRCGAVGRCSHSSGRSVGSAPCGR